MKNLTAILFAVFLIPFTSCQQDPGSMLPGSWQAHTVTEEDEPLPIDATEIQFEFTDSGTYQFLGTLNYREAGTYETEQGVLYTLDTLHEGSVRKKVMIRMPAPDSLEIRMQENDKQRTIYLTRNGQ